MPRPLQQEPGKAPAVHRGENLPKAKLSQGQPALVPRASVLGPELERWHFLHQRQQPLPPSLPTTGSVLSYMRERSGRVSAKQKLDL